MSALAKCHDRWIFVFELEMYAKTGIVLHQVSRRTGNPSSSWFTTAPSRTSDTVVFRRGQMRNITPGYQIRLAMGGVLDLAWIPLDSIHTRIEQCVLPRCF
jgi:hypothetical protein